MPRAGLTHERVVSEAGQFADAVGLEAVTISALAARLGVAQPSLYKHISSVQHLNRSIALRALSELAVVLSRAAIGRSRGDAVLALCSAYREWGRAHPGRYASLQRAPVPGDTEMTTAANELAGIFLSVFSGYGLDGDDAIDALRALRSALHGFVTLQELGGFGLPVDVDRSFHRMVTAFEASLPMWLSAGTQSSRSAVLPVA
ncbi:TetR/AcrR family transcriptional regulator [Rothia nasimurium]|uniref:TetR/AcrR family transcriptional regulator n=1 Tax=Luteibacter anthropi TaxID=564369 RepID=A0A7X5UB09_9GAMM|nr:TetR/AcrR family transcriptional regulator [Luteibacter anthropi]